MRRYKGRKSHLKNGLANAGYAWEKDEDDTLIERFNVGNDVGTIAEAHKRSKSAIAARLVRLGLIKKRSDFYKRRVCKL